MHRRRFLTGASLGALALSAGCKLFSPGPEVGSPPATKWAAAPKADDLVAYLNRNAQPVASIEAAHALVTAKQAGESPLDLDSYLACQKGARPGTSPNFRLQCYVVGNEEVDIGSNGQEFWFWIKRGGPYVYHCSYADYPEVAKRGALPFPVQPEWVVEALGMAEYDPRGKYEVNESKTTYDLVQRARSPRGTEMAKVIAFHKAPRAGQSQVAAYIIYEADAKGQYPKEAVCFARVEDSQAVVAGGKTVVLPIKVTISCPKEKLELTINLGKTRVNQPFGQSDPNILFTRRTLNNYKSYDLARGPDAPAGGVRPAGGLDR
ncbi:MAG TPA: hypothetical protein VFW33_23315 [Gemmataceae bacterium]|nr:hypothetical protein [Gemmataceae bacterium]